MPRWPRDLLRRSDFYVITADDPDRVADVIVELSSERIPRRFGFDPIRDERRWHETDPTYQQS
jgi:exodeoxyribonuclease V alpha subunit